MEERIVVMIMGQDCQDTIKMALESSKDADAIVYLDGGSKDKTLEIWNSGNKLVNYISNKFEKDKLGMNGIQRNFYLDYLKKNYKDWFCICLDADEVIDNLEEFRRAIKELPELGNHLLCPKMRHLIGNLCNEDATRPIHYVYNRFFKITDDLYYPLEEHGVLSSTIKEKQTLPFNDGLIWHMGYINQVADAMRRYNGQMSRLTKGSHDPSFLENWKNSHLLGVYPTRKVNPLDLPEVILNNYGINKDELYFANRGLEMKHPIMVHQWNDYFKPESVLDLGCGRGCYLYFWKWFIKIYKGIELSEWAIKNAFCDNIEQGQIESLIFKDNYDLVTCIDVLEHLNDDQLNKALENMSIYGKKFLFSIPFEGDPNLTADNTHKQFHDKEWWIKKIESYGIKINETPQDWLFKDQILVGEKI
jgi:SAM-dependent methyltransferase